MKKIISFLLLVTMYAAVFSACSENKQVGNGDITQLKMVLIGDTPDRYKEIYAELNKMLVEDINAEVTVEYIPYSAKTTKYPLLFSSNENFDMVFTGNWLSYTQNARKNSFYELTEDFIKKNAPITYETVPESAWQQATVNGKVFMVPNTALEYENIIYMIRGDWRKKLGVNELKNADDFEKYLQGLADKYPEITPVTDMQAVSYLWNKIEPEFYTEIFGGLRDGIVYKWDDETGKPFHHSMTDEYEHYMFMIKLKCSKYK